MGRFRGAGSRAALKKPALTHFLCIPLVNAGSKAQLDRALTTFRQDVTGVIEGGSTSPLHRGVTGDEPSNNALPRIHPKAVRPTGALHFTLGVMSLNRDQLIRAIDYLAKLDIAAILTETGSGSTTAQAIEGIKIDMQGLETMHGVESFLVNDDRELKLHATLINTIYAKSKKPEKKPVAITPTGVVISDSSPSDDRSYGHGMNANAPLKFDARSILESYKNYVWAESISLDRISICEMGAKKITNPAGEVIDECYTEVASVRMPA